LNLVHNNQNQHQFAAAAQLMCSEIWNPLINNCRITAQ
jgi:hypothetical protein